MNASKLYQALLSYETNGSNPPDSRRVIGTERQRLYAALGRVKPVPAHVQSAEIRARLEQARASAQEHLSSVAAEAERVARMWGVL